MAFRVGQKVVCVDGSPPACGHGPGVVKGRIYTVSAIGESSFGSPNFIDVEEVRGNCPWAQNFRASRFRPVAERKTDISIFTTMLNPSKEHVRS